MPTLGCRDTPSASWACPACVQALKEAQKHLSKSRSPAAAAQMEGLSRRISQLDRFVSAREHMLSDAATSVKICNALVGEVGTSIHSTLWKRLGGKVWAGDVLPVRRYRQTLLSIRCHAMGLEVGSNRVTYGRCVADIVHLVSQAE